MVPSEIRPESSTIRWLFDRRERGAYTIIRLNSVRTHMSQQEAIERLLERLERSLHQLTIRKSAVVSQLLADGFFEFGSSGRILTKAQILAELDAETPAEVTVSDFKVQLLAPHIALVTYRARRHFVPPRYALRTSIWEQRDGQWQMIFHQGTLTAAPP